MIYKAQGAPLKRVSHSISTIEPLQTATCLQRPFSSVPKVVVVESFDCISLFYLGKGNRRAIVLHDANPLGKTANLSWSRGWMCGWTPHGLCFSPDENKDIHNFYMIPFPLIKTHVYCEQRPNINSGWGFGLNSIILAQFSRANKGELWQGLVRRYTQNGHGTILKFRAKTFFASFGVNQVEQTFYAGQVYLEGNYTLYMYVQKSKILLDRSIWVVVDTDKLKPSTTLQYFRLPYILQNDNQNMFIFLLLIWPSLGVSQE